MATLASTLITRSLDNLSRASTGQARSGAALGDKAIAWMNTTLRRMARSYDFSEMHKLYQMSTVDGSKIYSFPSNYKTILSMRLQDGTSSRKLVHLEQSTYDRFAPYPESATESRPCWYIPYGQTFELYPIPDAAYVVQCRCVDWPTTITASTDSISYNEDKDELIVAGMTAEGWKYLQMYEDAVFWDGEFKKLFVEAKMADQAAPDYSPQGMGFVSDGYITASSDFWNDPFVRGSNGGWR